MAVLRMGFLVHYEDGANVEVVTDQRDVAAMERAEKVGFPTLVDTMPIVAFRFLAWHALRRTGGIDVKVSREDWDGTVIEVEPLDDGEAPGPGNAEASEGAS
jgi:hypothetical protein